MARWWLKIVSRAPGNAGRRPGQWRRRLVTLAPWGLLLLALALRLPWLDVKPPHSDEGVNGWLALGIPAVGHYPYDPENYHGPLFFYLLLLSQWLVGQDLWGLRLPALLFGVGSVALAWRLAPYLGRPAAAWGALFLAVSPGMVYFSRTAIHETGLVFFSLLAFLGLARYRCRRDRIALWQMGAGMAGMAATKEIWVVHLATLGIAALCLRVLERFSPSSPESGPPATPAPDPVTPRHVATVAAACGGALALLYTGFLANPRGIWDFARTYLLWGGEATGGSGHDKPFLYWSELLVRYEWPALAALLLLPVLLAPAPRVVRLPGIYAFGTWLAYSLIPYKTPWCVLQITWPLLLVAGWLVARLPRPGPRAWAPALAAIALLAVLQGAWAAELSWWRPTAESEPYVYVQTFPEVMEVIRELEELARLDPQTREEPVHVVIDGSWPLPWLLERFAAGFYTPEHSSPGDGLLLLVEESRRAEVEASLTGQYHQRTFRLSPIHPPVTAYLDAQRFAPRREAGAAPKGPRSPHPLRGTVLLIASLLAGGALAAAGWALRAGDDAGEDEAGLDGAPARIDAPRAATVIAWTLVGALFVSHAAMLWKTFTVDSEGAMRAAIAGYGDIPLHMTQVSKFAYGAWDLDEPIFAGARLQYPFAINLASGLLLRLSGAWKLSLLAPAILFAALGTGLSFWYYRTVLRRPVFAALALAVFLLGSGMGGYRYLLEAVEGRLSPAALVAKMTEESASTITRFDAVHPQQNIAYGAPMSLVLLHQRPFLMGLAGFAAALCLMVLSFGRAWKVVGVGVLLGSLPLIHAHSFVATAVALGVMGGIQGARRRSRDAKTWLLALLLGGALAIPQLAFLMGGRDTAGPDTGFMALRLGWMVEPTIGSAQFRGAPSVFSTEYATFLWTNFGLMIPLFLAGTAWLVSRMRRGARLESQALLIHAALAAAALFLLVQTVRFQPWDFDNNKLLVYAQFFAAPLIVCPLMALYEHRRFAGLAIGVVALTGVLFSGALDIAPRLRAAEDQLPVIFSTEAQETADSIRALLPRDALILTSTTHLNPVSSLAGRQVTVGFPGWLWTRGIEYAEREAAVRRFFEDPESHSGTLDALSISYILLDPHARYEHGADPELFDARFEKVFASGTYVLYRR